MLLEQNTSINCLDMFCNTFEICIIFIKQIYCPEILKMSAALGLEESKFNHILGSSFLVQFNKSKKNF